MPAATFVMAVAMRHGITTACHAACQGTGVHGTSRGGGQLAGGRPKMVQCRYGRHLPLSAARRLKKALPIS